MKKWIAYALLILAAWMLTACGGGEDSAKLPEQTQTAAPSMATDQPRATATPAATEQPGSRLGELAGEYYADELYTLQILEDGTGRLVRYKGSETDVVIPSRIECFAVTEIGDEVFLNGQLTSVVIPGTVKAIGARAFRGNGNLTRVTLGSGVETIGNAAFYDCVRLSVINIPRSVKTIGTSAFVNCGNLEEITLPAGITSVGEYAFFEANPTAYVEKGSAAEAYCLQNAMNVAYGAGSVPTESTEKDTVRTLKKDDVFWVGIDVDKGLYTEARQFRVNADHTLTFDYYRGGNTFVRVPGYLGDLHVTNIGYHALDNGTLLEAAIEEGVEALDAEALVFSFSSRPVSVTLPASIRSIDDYGCGIPGSVRLTVVKGSYADEYLQQSGFTSYAYTDGTQLTPAPTAAPTPSPTPLPPATPLPAGSPPHLRLLGTWTANKGRTEITFTENSVIVGNREWAVTYDNGKIYADDYIPALDTKTSYWRLGQDGQLVTHHATSEDDPSDNMIYWTKKDGRIPEIATYAPGVTPVPTPSPEPTAVPEIFEFSLREDGTAVLVKYNGTDADVVVPGQFDGHAVTEIGTRAFEHREGIVSVHLPDSVAVIGDTAFLGCPDLVSVNTPGALTAIGRSAFSGCTSLKAFLLPSALQTIGDSAFSFCAALREITLPASASVGENVFLQSGLERITLEEGVERIPNGLLIGCEQLAHVELPSSVAFIGEDAFARCKQLTAITIPPKVTAIAKGTFSDCESLETVVWPENLQSIGKNAFSGCAKLARIEIPATVKSIGAFAFAYCRSAQGTITIPQGISAIENAAFKACERIAAIVIPDGVTVIDKEAFSFCKAVETLQLPEGVTTIDNYAFSHCSSLQEINIPASVTRLGKHVFDECKALTVSVAAGSQGEQYCQENGVQYTAQ